MDSANPIFRALEQLRFSYDVRHTPEGKVYAGFKWATDGLPELSVTAIHTEGIARFQVHDLGAVPATAVEEVRQLERVAMFADPYSGKVQLRLSIDLVDAALDGPELLALLFFLAECVAVVTGPSAKGGWAWARRLFGAASPPPRTPGIPNLRPGARVPPVEECVIELPRLEKQARISFQEDVPGWLVARGEIVSPQRFRLAANQIPLVDKLQNWAPYGRFLLQPDGELRVEVASPLLDRPSGPLAERAVGSIIQLLGTAVLHANR